MKNFTYSESLAGFDVIIMMSVSLSIQVFNDLLDSIDMIIFFGYFIKL
jgi:hypothetical protein